VGAEKGKPVLRGRGTGGLREAAAGFKDEEARFRVLLSLHLCVSGRLAAR